MDWSFMDRLGQTIGQSVPNVLGALLILIGGWLIAVILRAAVRRSLAFLRLNERLRSEAGGKADVEGGIARGVYWAVCVLAVIAFFNALELALEPLETMMERFLAAVPNLVAGGVLMLIAWVLATALRRIVVAGLGETRLDEKLSEEAGIRPMSQTLGNVVYGLILLLFLPAVLGAFGLQGLLGPIQNMVDEILGALPNVLAAAVLGFVGWIVARLLQNLVSNLLQVAGADRLGQKAGLRGTMTLSRLIGLVTFVFVFVPALIAALNALEIDAIARPATDMLSTLMGALPGLFAAALILSVAFFVADIAGSLATGLLGGLGFDRLPEKLGLKLALGEMTPSRLVGRVIVFFVLLFAVVEAANVLGFTQVSELVSMFIEFGGDVLLGVAIIVVGLWFANLAHAAISRLQRPNAAFMAGLARITILGLVLAMGLRSMGIADDIVELAFGLTLGAVAVAFALSFGLGGREAAGKQMELWLARMRGEQ